MTTQPDMLVIGFGNIYRHDDAVGIAVARQLQGLTPAGVSIVEDAGYGLAWLETWHAQKTVILVDATSSGAPPGTIHRIDARKQKFPRGTFHSSTHGFSVGEAIEFACALNQMPPRFFLFGIEGKDFTPGIGLSDEVERAMPAVIRQVLRHVEKLQVKSMSKARFLGPD